MAREPAEHCRAGLDGLLKPATRHLDARSRPKARRVLNVAGKSPKSARFFDERRNVERLDCFWSRLLEQ
jgi:hypothetical protein